jgi:hypothetical protein
MVEVLKMGVERSDTSILSFSPIVQGLEIGVE